MAAPTATQIRALIEGYGISVTVLTDAWIESCRDEEIIPHIQDITKQTFSAETEVTEYYSGTGGSMLILNRKPVNSITSIAQVGGVGGNLSGMITLIGDEGIIRASGNYPEGVYSPVFSRGTKNIVVTYKYGTSDYPADVSRAIKCLVCAKALNLIQARTGGGSISVQAFNRNFGSHGKFTDIRKELVYTGYSILKKYMTGIVGS